MVLAPFFLAFGAFGGGLFVASPCVMRVVVLGREATRARRVSCGGRAFLGVCAGPALGARGGRRAMPPRFRFVPAAGRFGAPAAVAALRRFAEALRGGRRGPAAPRSPVFDSSARMSNFGSARPVFDAVTHQHGSHDVCHCESAALLNCGAVRARQALRNFGATTTNPKETGVSQTP